MPQNKPATSTKRRSTTPHKGHKARRKPIRTDDRRPLIGSDLECCVYCNTTTIAKSGKRYKHREILQRWFCHTCNVSFSQRSAGKGSTYPLKVILESLCHFYQGYTLDQTTKYINRRFDASVHPHTISSKLTLEHPKAKQRLTSAR